MKITEGLHYITRDARIVGPMRYIGDGVFTDDEVWVFGDTGLTARTGEEFGSDIISEWKMIETGEAEEPEIKKVLFNYLCYGARFRYTPKTKIWVKIGPDTIAEWDASNVATKWIGQTICAFSDDGDFSRPVYLVPELPSPPK